MSDLLLSITGVSKSFGEVTVLRDVDLEIRTGEVHALVGENGAGKSTLMKIVSGVYSPSAGSMSLDGRAYQPKNPLDAMLSGIGIVHQELSLAPDVSVAENMFIGRDSGKGRLLDWRELNRRASEMLSEFDLDVHPSQPVSELSLGYRQVVEILKALASDPRAIIFDEPTSALEAHETDLVLGMIRKLAQRGVGAIYISHRMDEVFQLADRITVLRDGELVWTREAGKVTRDEVINAMVGREMTELYPEPAAEIREELLRVENLEKNGLLHGIGFSLHRGEILGFSGLVGSGRTELMRAIFGADRLDSGAVFLEGKQVNIRSVSDAMEYGIAYLPEDRKGLGLFLDRSIEDNIICGNLDRCSAKGLMDSGLCRKLAHEYSGKLAVKARDVDQEVASLSGGNQQKVLLARWMAMGPKVLIVDEPTRGVDVGAKGEIHRMLRDYADRGNGVILVSSEMPEVIGLCDRIIVLREGRKAGEVLRKDASEERLINLSVA